MTSIEEYDFKLPEAQIAQEPASKRDASRTLFLTRSQPEIHQGLFSQLGEHLTGDECFVVNNTRVIPARLNVQRASGGMVEAFLLRQLSPLHWHAWLSPSRRIKDGEILSVAGHESRKIQALQKEGSFWHIKMDADDLLAKHGQIPLPPYIGRQEQDNRSELDKERYQTLFAQEAGAVAAPTAGLHFSQEAIEALGKQNIPIVPVTLHVGPGTFQPVKVDLVQEHQVAPELIEITSESRATLAKAKKDGRKIICVGTTSVRMIESLDELAGDDLRCETDLTILPGYKFKHVDGIITNFHLPKSSLLILVASFHGHDQTLTAYRYAVEEGFRFYSYGDCMAILPERS